MKKYLPLTLLLFFATIITHAQTEPCGTAGDEPPGCLMCGPIYIGSTSGYTPGTPGPTFPCGSIENNQWIAIIAGSTNISATILASNCQNSQGVQLLIYDTNLNPVSTCFSSGGNNIPGNVSASGLTPGEVYWIMIDGFAGDICDITLTVTGGQNTGPPDPPGPITMNPDINPLCPGAIVDFSVAPVFGASWYEWTVPGNGTILGDDDGNAITVEFDSPGAGVVCVTPNNACFPGAPTCIPVTVLPLPPTILPPEFICEEDFPITVDGNTFNSPGTYTITFTTAIGCDSNVVYNFLPVIIPPVIRPNQFVCPEDFPIFIDGNRFDEAGFHEIVYTSSQGCDSAVTYPIFEIPRIPFVIDTVLCAGECITIGQFNTFCDPGDHEVLIPDATVDGCDSLVRLFLDYIEVEADIAIPPPLGCSQNPTVTLDGTGSTTGPGVTYEWSASNGGVLIGPTDEITATAGAAGSYTLTVTVVENGRSCSDSETTSVVNDASVPPAPTFQSGPLSVCENEVATYTIANIPSATGYNWTVTPPATYTGSGTSIEVTWGTAGQGQVCVEATNDCGPSPQTCLDVTIHPIPVATFDMPPAICVSDSATIVYNGNASPNANYNWTFNGGTPAMVSGPGPHLIQWATTGTRNVSLVVEENGCISQQNTQQIEIEDVLPAPVINCNPTINSVTFSWNPVPGADNYDIIIDGTPAGNQTTTTYNVNNLTPNTIVNITVIANGSTSCGPSQSSSDCQAQDCPQVSLDIDPVNNICRDASSTPFNLTYQISGDNGTGTFTWGGNAVDVNGVFDPAQAMLGNNTVTLTYEEGNCTYNTSLIIVVNEAPTNDFTIESPICESDVSNITYTGNASSNATYTWNFGTGNNTTGASGEGPYEIQWTDIGDQDVSLTVEENGCASAVNLQTVQVDEELEVPVISCNSTTNTINLSWTTDPNATYTVNVLAGATGTQNGSNYDVSGILPGDSTVLEVIANGTTVCGPVADTLTCIASDCPPVVLSIDPIGPFCDDGSSATVSLSATVTGGTGNGTFSWTGPGVVNGNEFDPNDPAVIAGSINRVRVTYEEANCTFDDAFDVEVNPQPSSTFTLNGPICITDATTIEHIGTPVPNSSFTWNVDGGTPATLSGPGPHMVNWSTSGTKRISLLVDANNCISDTTFVPLNVDTLLPPPVISCNSTTSTVDFSWSSVPGATGYTVNLIDGSGGTYDGGFAYNVNGVTVGDSTTIEVIATGPTVCGPSSTTMTCYAAPCPPIELSLDTVPEICLYQNTLSTDLNDFLTVTGSATGIYNLSWDGGSYITPGGSFFPNQSSTGTHPFTATVTESGCSFDITGYVTVKPVPLASMAVEQLICVTDSASVFFNGLASSTATFNWDFGNGTDAWQQGGPSGPFDLVWNNAGTDTVSLWINDNGCISDTIQTPVTIDAELVPPVINCEGGVTGVVFSWDDVPGATDYTVSVDDAPNGATFDPDTPNSYSVNSILPLDEVTITLTVSDSLSPCGPVSTTATCIADDCPTVLLSFDEEPPICLDANAVNADLSDNIIISGNLSNNGTFTWSGSGVSPDGQFNPFQAGVGVHELTLTYEEFNCTYTETFEMTVNDLPIADAGADQSITCIETVVTLGGDGNNQNPPSVTYSWSGQVNDPNALFTNASTGGTYILTATDTQTGCVNTDEVEVILENEAPELNASVENISCFGRNDGNIVINGADNGTPPFLYSYNDAPFSSQTFFNNLGPGTHVVAVEDANGCRDTVTFTINEPDELNVEIIIVSGENPVLLGDSIQLSAITNYAPDLLTNVSWTPIDQFPICDEVNITNCLTAWVTPTGQTVYTVRIEAGPCAAEDNVQLNVKKIRPVYIPSGFSPNNEDGINDGFQIFADPEIATRVKSFLVFNRWGEMVFEAYDFEPSLVEKRANAWDGTFRGKQFNSGVFVYFAEIEFFDGVTEIFKGDVTISE